MDHLPGEIVSKQIQDLQSAVKSAVSTVGRHEGRQYVYFCGEEGFKAMTKSDVKAWNAGQSGFSQALQVSTKEIKEFYTQHAAGEKLGKIVEFAADLRALAKSEPIWSKIATKISSIGRQLRGESPLKSKLETITLGEIASDRKKLISCRRELNSLQEQLKGATKESDKDTVGQLIADTARSITALEGQIKNGGAFLNTLSTATKDKLDKLRKNPAIDDAKGTISASIKDSEKLCSEIKNRVAPYLSGLPATTRESLEGKLQKCLEECQQNISQAKEREKEMNLWGILNVKSLDTVPDALKLTAAVMRPTRMNADLIGDFLASFHAEVMEAKVKDVANDPSCKPLSEELRGAFKGRGAACLKYMEKVAEFINMYDKRL